MSSGKVFRWFLNSACLLILIGALVVLVRDRRANKYESSPNIGRTVNLPSGVSDGRPKLLLFLSTKCPWCKLNASLYRRLMRAPGIERYQVIAFLPEAPSIARSYLKQEGFTFPFLDTDSFSGIAVSGTPTIILVDSSNKIEREWSGYIDDHAETGFGKLVSLGIPQHDNWAEPLKAPEASESLSSEAQIADLVVALSRPGSGTVLDVRERDDFEARHLSGVVNIPLEELPFRAPHELDKDQAVYALCQLPSGCTKAQGMDSACDVVASILAHLGYSRVVPIVLTKEQVQTVQDAVGEERHPPRKEPKRYDRVAGS